jgi:hypothetical protein
LLLESELLQEIIIIEPKIKNSREIFRVNISFLPSRTTYLSMFAKAERKKKGSTIGSPYFQFLKIQHLS